MMFFRKLLMLVSLLVSVAFMTKAQTSREEDLDKIMKQAQEEFKQILNCDRLIKALDDELLGMSKDDMQAYLLMRTEIEKAKADILKNCVNGIYQAQDTPPEEVIEAEPVPSDGEKKMMERLAKLQQGVANTETYGELYYGFTRIPKSISFYMESTVTKEKFAQWMSGRYGVYLQLLQQDNRMLRYQQTLDNIPLLGCMYTVLLRNDGSVQKASGLLYAAKRANSGNVAGYSTIYQRIKTKYPDIVSDQNTALIYVQKSRSYKDSNFYLCYTFYDDRTAYYFDAVDGRLIHSETYVFNCFQQESNPDDNEEMMMKEMFTPEEVGTAKNPEFINTYYYGLQKLETLRVSDQLFMLRTNSTDDKNAVITFDSLVYNGNPNTPICVDNKWTTDQFREKGLIDAYIGGEKTMAYFKNKLYRQSFDNAAASLSIYYQPFEDQANKSVNGNAEWNHRAKVIAYGMINGKPLSSVDVIAHEFAHAVVHHHVPGLPYFGEQGAINEGVSDIIASAVEKYAGLQGSNHWQILELQGSKSLRDFSRPNPSLFARNFEGKNWVDQAKCTNDSVQKDLCGVHINSTVISHWYYLLVNGGKGVNEHNKQYEVFGTFSIDEAAELVYESIYFLMPHMNFKDYADMVIEISEKKYGEQDSKTCTVKNAWYAVGVLVDAPEKCVPGWTFTLFDEPVAKAVFYGKGDSIVISVLDKETGFRNKMYRYKQSAYWKVVGETEDGIERMTIPNDFMQQLLSYDNARNLVDFQHEYMEQSIREMRERLKDPDLTAEQRAEATYMLSNAERVYAQSKAMSEQSLAEIKASELENSQYPMLMTEEDFWGSNKEIRAFDKQFLRGSFLYEGLNAKKYDMGNDLSWTSTTEIPYGLGDLAFVLPGTLGDMKLGADHFLRGFPLVINGQKIAVNIKEYVPNNFDALFSDAPVF